MRTPGLAERFTAAYLKSAGVRYLAAGALLSVGLAGTWAAAHTLTVVHVRQVAGRDKPAGVSCRYCHRRGIEPVTRRDQPPQGYISPAGLAVSPDGTRLYVAASGDDRLLEVDLQTGRVNRSVPLPGRPHGIDLSGDGQVLAVSCRDADRVAVLDADRLEVQRWIETPGEPLGVSLARDGRSLAVTMGAQRQVLLVDLDPGGGRRSLLTGIEPFAAARSTDGERLAVISRRVRPSREPEVPASEITFISTSSRRVTHRRLLESAHLGEDIVLAGDGSFVLAPVVRFRNFLPTTQVARGAVMTSALAFMETDPGGLALQLPLDEVNSFFADPSGIALTPDDRLAFVAHGGADVVSVVDVVALRALLARTNTEALPALAEDLGAFTHYVLARIPTLSNPRAVVASPDGSRIYVAEHLADTVAVIDSTLLAVVERIDLGGRTALTAVRRGERVFHDGRATFQGQFSCRSCHPDGSSDGLVWDFEIDGVGRNKVDTRSLRGIRHTAPFKWNGKNKDLHTQCGPRFSRVLMRSAPFTPDRLDDLVSFIESMPLPPPRVGAGRQAARERGRAVFSRTVDKRGHPVPVEQRCSTCHRPPLFTDRLPSTVGTGAAFDTPHLLDVAASAPYLHDGRALTLEEIWTVHSLDDQHGVTSDLTKAELNDLVVFLGSL